MKSTHQNHFDESKTVISTRTEKPLNTTRSKSTHQNHLDKSKPVISTRNPKTRQGADSEKSQYRNFSSGTDNNFIPSDHLTSLNLNMLRFWNTNVPNWNPIYFIFFKQYSRHACHISKDVSNLWNFLYLHPMDLYFTPTQAMKNTFNVKSQLMQVEQTTHTWIVH